MKEDKKDLQWIVCDKESDIDNYLEQAELNRQDDMQSNVDDYWRGKI